MASTAAAPVGIAPFGVHRTSIGVQTDRIVGAASRLL
jgi:hypothetical protein